MSITPLAGMPRASLKRRTARAVLGPKNPVTGQSAAGMLGNETSHVSVEPDGSIVIVTQQHPHGQSHQTTLAQVASDERIDVIHAHYAVPHAVSAFLAKEILGGSVPKIVTTLHGTDITLVGADESFHRVTKFAIVSPPICA